MARKSKAERQAARAKRIEKRKGLAAGEGAKVMANRKQRLKEWFTDPGTHEKNEKGEITKHNFTKKYEGKTKGEGMFDKFKEGEKRQEFTAASEAQKIKNKMAPPKWSDMFSKGGGFDASMPSEDKTDIGSNASGLYRKKKGWTW